ncbi:MAG TPA: hypothetical protein PK831_02375 [Candidatus Magasanikbacteria bacterium]|jgi:hypothetical protein|nr:hypothetical protein [Candidatus Magasanikbacteria bacterium]HQL53019.1 hypothetical protein [Candidatus Magasanikbacteria bacterium]
MVEFFTKLINNFKKDIRGSSLIFVLVFGSIAMMIIIFGVSGYTIFENRASIYKHERNKAFHIAEAGINYYRWHLAHSPNDYQDGTGEIGPYEHEYKDRDGNVIGYFSLEIIPPLAGSSVVTIRSTGWTISAPKAKRTIQVRVGFPSLTNYSMLSNASLNFGFTTVVHGPVHSNGLIRFDGLTDSWVNSHVRVQGGGGPKSFWRYPVPAVDFYGVTTDLSAIRDQADAEGIHLTSSGVEGWYLVFQGDNFDLYKVTSRDCYYGEGVWRRRRQNYYWEGSIHCHDIGNKIFVNNYDIPENGAIFIEDNTWVEGVVDGRVSIGVGKFPVQEPFKKIYITNNLVYNEKAGDDVIGLMAQGEIIVPYEAPYTMEINAAMFSQFESIYHPYYYQSLRDSLTIFGAQISYEGGGWKYTNNNTAYGHVVTGYENTYHSYDANLKYFPPPGFPVGKVYELISWEEI